MPTPKEGYYNAAGEQLPGCTTVLSAVSNGSLDPLLGWAVKLSKEGLDFRRERERAAQVGTFIHDVLERYPEPMPARPMWTTEEEWSKAVKAYGDYAAWRAAIAPVVLAQEVQLVSELHQAGGTFDMLLKVGDSVVIADHKTGKSIDIPKVSAQLGFYAATVQEKLKQRVDKGLILHYTAKGLKPIELSRAQLDAGLDIFVTARRAYKLFKTFPRA